MITKIVSKLSLSFFLLPFLVIAQPLQTVKIHKLISQPVLDGKAEDWSDIPFTHITISALRSSTSVATANEVLIKAGYFEDSIYFYAKWSDNNEDLEHKPYIWDNEKNKYLRGPQREDRFAMQFEMSGDFSANWLSGNDFVADMWHWKSWRSNVHGIAHDKKTTVSRSLLLRSAKMKDPVSGNSVYVLRENDNGDRLYRATRYFKKEKDVMPKYIITPNPKGSIADVNASAMWRDNFWHLEMQRKLNTGHDDDVAFTLDTKVKGAIAVFDRSSNNEHSISKTLLFTF